MGEPSLRQSILVGLPLTRVDKLQIRVWNFASSVKVITRWQMFTDQGEIVQDDLSITPTTAGAVSADTKTLQAGQLLTLTCQLITGQPKRGQCFIQVNLLRGTTTYADAYQTLLQGYLTYQHTLSYPGSPLQHALEGPGARDIVTMSDSGAGQVLTVVGTDQMLRIVHSLAFEYQCSATVASRYLRLETTNSAGGHPAGLVPFPEAMTASQGWELSFVRGASYVVDTTNFFAVLPLPFIVLDGSSDRIQTQIINGQSGDNHLNPRLSVEDWILDT